MSKVRDVFERCLSGGKTSTYGNSRETLDGANVVIARVREK